MSEETQPKVQVVAELGAHQKSDGTTWDTYLVAAPDNDSLTAGAIEMGEQTGAEEVRVTELGQRGKAKSSYGFTNWGGSRWRPTGPRPPWGHNEEFTGERIN